MRPNTSREQIMNQKNTTWRAMAFIFLLGWTGVCGFVPTQSYGATAAEVLKNYGKLSSKERETKLIDGAKREGKLVYYGSILADQMKHVFDEFNKKYPFVTVGTYRGGALDVYNRITTEALAKKNEVDAADMD